MLNEKQVFSRFRAVCLVITALLSFSATAQDGADSAAQAAAQDALPPEAPVTVSAIATTTASPPVTALVPVPVPPAEPNVIADLARAALAQFFSNAHLPPPEGVKAAVKADASPVTIDLFLSTDHPDSVISEARNFVQRDLESRGYVFDLTVAEKDPRIPARLTVSSEMVQTHHGLQALDPRNYHSLAEAKSALLPQIKPLLVFSALSFGAVFALVLSLVMLARLFRRAPRERALAKVMTRTRNRGSEPPVFAAPELHTGPVFTPEPSAPRTPSVPAPVNSALENAATQIEQMPFEQAMRLLAKVGPAERQALFDRLKLQQSVRQRLERELEAGLPGLA